MATHVWRTLTRGLATSLARAGLDLAAGTRADRYNRAVPADYRLPDFGRPQALVIVVGNSRALWPRFLAWLADDPLRLDLTDPLDDYVEACVLDVAEDVPHRTEVRFAHEPPPRRVAIQRLAEQAGLARIAPSQLCVHPIHGPWISLRAAVVIDLDGPSDPQQPPPDPCLGCTDSCRSELLQAIAASTDRGPRQAWREWIRVRDACPIGGEHRFSEPQLRYHALAERDLLRSEVERYRGVGGSES